MPSAGVRKKCISMKTDRRGRNRTQDAVEEGAPAWMVTFSDMITLILAFFVLLFSFANINEVKFHELLSSIRGTFIGTEGILDGARDPAEIDDSITDQERLLDAVATVEKILEFIKEKGLEGTMEVLMDERGIVLEISDALFFDPGKAELKANALEILSYVAELLGTVDKNQVVVEGHTDNVPINTHQFPSNWELSVARAVVVVRHLVEIKQLDPTRFVAMGFGEFRPVASNMTAEGRAKNRRVNIIISNLSTASAQEGVL